MHVGSKKEFIIQQEKFFVGSSFWMVHCISDIEKNVVGVVVKVYLEKWKTNIEHNIYYYFHIQV